MPVKYDVSNIPPFYQNLMNMWSLFSHQKVTPPSPVDGVYLLNVDNSYVTHNSDIITRRVESILILEGRNLKTLYVC